MAALASPTSPSSCFLPPHLLLHASTPSGLQQGERGLPLVLLRDGTPATGRGPQHNAILPGRKVATAAPADDTPTQGSGPHTNAVLEVRPRGGGELRLSDPPVQGDGPKINAVLEIKPRGGAPRRPTPPGGAGPKEGTGGRGGAIHAVARSTPQRPGSPAGGAGGNGGAVHAAPAASSS
uniref:Uncharacterized protein n=1 Tax=Oryza brachyantha TaxID=4533 RepID=J3MQS8_ORYBR